MVFIGAIYGALSGVIWAFSLGGNLTRGLWVGGLVGGILGLAFGILGGIVSSGGTVQKREAAFVSGSFLVILFAISVALSIVTGIIRWVF